MDPPCRDEIAGTTSLAVAAKFMSEAAAIFK
jgi:hypothetical protein